MDKEINDLIIKIHNSKKYKNLSIDTITDIVVREFSNNKNKKEGIAFAKKRLHKILADYLGEPNYKVISKDLESAFLNKSDNLITEICLKILSIHSSAKERNVLLPTYYQTLFEHTGIPSSIADLACALHPFSFRWMQLPKTIRYYAYDINKEFVDFISFYFKIEEIENLIFHQDILCNPPVKHVDVAFLFKMYHCLEIRRKGAGWEVVEKVPANFVLISFPTQSLASRQVNILANYENAIVTNTQKNNWKVN
jgi:16S rRNA (guanine(1405)-N(7))-methyltransferase